MGASKRAPILLILKEAFALKHHLSIDIETYSSVPIAESGLYKYAQSSDFEILLIAYSLDGGPVVLIDLAQGDKVPLWFLNALHSDEYIKHAYNAAFEWYCLSRRYGLGMPVDQWRCTMLHALLKRALGYDYTEERVEVSKENGKKSVKTTQTVKHVPPDTTAQIFWLKNRRPDRWRDKQQLEHSGSVDVNPLAGLTTEELRKLAGSDG